MRGRGARRLLSTRRGSAMIEPVQEQIRRAADHNADVVMTSSGQPGAHLLRAGARQPLPGEIVERYPGLIEALVAHEGVGLVLIRCLGRGPIVFSKQGVRELDPDGVLEGDDPLGQYGEHAHDFFRRLAEYEYAGDIVVNGSYDPEKRWVIGFDDLVGAHGGLGGPQTQPFLIYPCRVDGRGADAGRLGGRAPLLEAAHVEEGPTLNSGKALTPNPSPLRGRGEKVRRAGGTGGRAARAGNRDGRWRLSGQPPGSEPALRHPCPGRWNWYLDNSTRERAGEVPRTDWRLQLDPGNVGMARRLARSVDFLPTPSRPRYPGVWNTTFPGYAGVAWYEATFQPARPAPEAAWRLVVGAANYLTDAWLNGVYLGRHEGGYDAFSFRCTDVLRDGENRLTLRIVDPPPEGEIDGLRLRECPTGKESWYGGYGGPWGGVWLEWSSSCLVRGGACLRRSAG